MKHLIIFLFLLGVAGCQTPVQQSQTLTPNKFADATIRTIYTAQDERKTEALLSYLTHANATYRQEAALAFASVQDSLAISPLTQLLTDETPAVRRAAAYALGQTGKRPAEEALLLAIEKERELPVKAELLEAIGKCASQKGLDALIRLDFSEPLLQAGQAWGIYRTHSRQLDYQKALTKAVTFLTFPNPEVRLAAAHFLARTPKLELTPHLEAILTTAQIDPAAEIRMVAVQALSKIKSDKLPAALAGIRQTDPDYRVQINTLRAMAHLDYAAVKSELWQALSNKNTHTALTAADLILAKALPEEAPALLQKTELTVKWRVRATLLAAVMKLHPNKGLILTTIQTRYEETTNPYEKAALLTAAAKDITGTTFVEQETFMTKIPAIRTAGIEALAQLRSEKTFPVNQKKHFAGIFQRAIASGDVALIGIAAGIIRQPELNFKAEYWDISFLKAAQSRLVLPRDMETYQEVQKTLHYLTGNPTTETPQNPFTHPIDWQLVQRIPANQTVEIQTGKGAITLQLFINEAPGTVANFVQLAGSGFFDGKNFHRVVPNFVVQGGDPQGDGWGGTDYALRSEFANLRYREGYVGMASAGKDTESCQWFITHSPTPHLDGRYTIFAKVTKGLEVLHLLEVGDKIEQINLK